MAHRRTLNLTLVAFAALALACPVAAQALDKPAGTVVLSLKDKIGQRNAGAQADFDLGMLERLPQQTIGTKTPWDDQLVRFSGPLLRDVLAAAKATGTQLRAVAINDYKATIPFEDLQRYGVIVALRMYDRPIPPRTRGPLWVIYPYDSAKSAAEKKDIENRSIWQLRSIEIE